MQNTTYSNSGYGALSVRESDIEIEEMTFAMNKPAEFGGETTARRNLACYSSKIRLGSTAEWEEEEGEGEEEWGEEEKVMGSMWFWEENCTTMAEEEVGVCNLFQPFLEKVFAEEKEEEMKLRFEGKDFFPCGLGFVVGVKKVGSVRKEKEYELDAIESERNAAGSFSLSILEYSELPGKVEVQLAGVRGSSGGGGVERSSRIGRTKWVEIKISSSNDSTGEGGEGEGGGKEGQDPEGEEAEARKKAANTVITVCFAFAGLFLVVSVVTMVCVGVAVKQTRRMEEELEMQKSAKRQKRQKRKRGKGEGRKGKESELQKEIEEVLKFEELMNEESFYSTSITTTSTLSLSSSTSTPSSPSSPSFPSSPSSPHSP
eukprot:MONOS_7265.1-p1 / transcript=MONOS_7265.1 / gene=MONOS_7265 / organism=Monocercomonoides_exilis_PA203 / gene_product=unspecified product / transcript_product=unspecified product / location=Mono_scaffold00244:31481-32599(+) / protein_length=373 / sequence_SO=supercontig / SO=protein_coding / is_pseudo=false